MFYFHSVFVLKTDIGWEQVPVQRFSTGSTNDFGDSRGSQQTMLLPLWLTSGSRQSWVRILTSDRSQSATEPQAERDKKDGGVTGPETKGQRHFRSIPAQKQVCRAGMKAKTILHEQSEGAHKWASRWKQLHWWVGAAVGVTEEKWNFPLQVSVLWKDECGLSRTGEAQQTKGNREENRPLWHTKKIKQRGGEITWIKWDLNHLVYNATRAFCFFFCL